MALLISGNSRLRIGYKPGKSLVASRYRISVKRSHAWNVGKILVNTFFLSKVILDDARPPYGNSNQDLPY